jgi:hypothetical protein
METCYVVATLDTRTLQVTDVGFFSSEAKSLTVMSHDYMYLDVFEFGGVDYHRAFLSGIDYILAGSCPLYLRWLRPFAKRQQEKYRNTPKTIVVQGHQC